MSYTTWTYLKLWLGYFMVFFLLSLAIDAGKGWLKGELVLTAWEILLDMILPAVLATFLVRRTARQS